VCKAWTRPTQSTANLQNDAIERCSRPYENVSYRSAADIFDGLALPRSLDRSGGSESDSPGRGGDAAISGCFVQWTAAQRTEMPRPLEIDVISRLHRPAAGVELSEPGPTKPSRTKAKPTIW
jgi:hypothetical protein